MERVKAVLGFYKDNKKFEVVDCTNDLKNWDDVTISLTRSDYTGVVRSISSQFEFVGETKDKISDYYSEFYLNTQIKVNIYQINENWLYDLIFQGDLDFSTLQMDELVLSINAKDNTLSSVIKANKSTKFDIPTVDVRADKKLKYDRINILNRVQWTTDDANEETNEPYKFRLTQDIPDVGTYYIPIPLAYMASETYRCPFEYRDQAQELIKEAELDFANLPGIVKVHSAEPFRLNVNFNLYVKDKPQGSLSIILGKINAPIASKTLIMGEQNSINFNAPIVNGQNVYGLYFKIEKISQETELLDIEYTAPSQKDGYFTRGSIAYAECFGKGKETEFNCIDITKLANTLVRKIYPNASVEIDTLPTQCILVSGEDMRELNNAKVSTSFSEFASFMETCFGFTYTISDRVVRFGQREVLFSSSVVKEVTSYNDLNYSQDTSLMYSRVKVGYNKQDYQNTNGKNEFNQSIEYSTDVNLTDNTLELISPYRADGYGFEFKVQEIENEVRDNTFSLEDEDKNDTDKDIFVLSTTDDKDYYYVKKDTKAFVPADVFSNNKYIGIKELYISKDINELYGYGIFGNYYLTAYLKDTIEQGIATFRFAPIKNGTVADFANAININVPYRESGVETYARSEATITVDWDYLNLNLQEFNTAQLEYPVSFACYKRDIFNFDLNPRLCAVRNQFMYLPCTQELRFVSSESNADLLFLGANMEKLNGDLSFGGRDMTVNKITFTTDETTLPTDKSGKVKLVANGKTYEGWIINATQNIGRNEPSEYELILAQS